MHAPETNETTPVFDPSAIASELAASDAYARSGHTARTVARAPDLRIVVIAIGAGHRIAEHQAQATASLQVISGRVRVHVAAGDLELDAGELLLFEAGLPHDVEAIDDSALVLTLGWNGAPQKNGAT